MKVLVIGLGLAGQELARQLRADGHTVVGTTTTEAKVDELKQYADDIRLLRGSDPAAVASAAQGCDAIAVCAGPAAARAMTREDRAASYREVLVDTANSVVAAPVTGPVVALSSLSVYGDAADRLDRVDEDSPVTASDDPSPQNFLAMEQVYLTGAPDRACVFRCADIYGNDDPPLAAKVKMAHEYLGGSVPFSADALLYRIDVRDVAAAMRHAIEQGLTGLFNLTHTDVPDANQAVFDAAGAAQGLPPLAYRGEIKSPSRPISVDRLLGSGFSPAQTKVARR